MNARKKIVGVVNENFPNGVRDDFIDTNKVLKIYRTRYTEKISHKDIADFIRINGLEEGGRFYFVSDEDARAVDWFFEEILATNPIVYYSVAHEKHADFFMNRNIFSPEVLRKVLRENGCHFYFDEFCSLDRFARLDREVANFFMAAAEPLSLEDLQQKFPYVPTENFLDVLDTKTYLRTNEGNFIHVSKIRFDKKEIFSVGQKILSLVEANGCAAPEDYDLSSNFALNAGVAESDLLGVIHEKFFSADFIRRGKKFFKKGSVAVSGRAKTLTRRLKSFLIGFNELSFEKLSETARGFGINKYDTALNVAHESMIHVEENLFVANTAIKFDISGVDEALASFVRGKIISLRAVTSFTGFPSVKGYSWNLFLLESFLRKFSKKYACLVPTANNLNIGAIYPKSMKFEDYIEVQAAVVVQERVPLEKSPVGEFLVKRGFRARRVDKVTERVILRAHEMIDRGCLNVCL